MLVKGRAKFVCKKEITSKDGKMFRFVTLMSDNSIIECFDRSVDLDLKFGQEIICNFETNGKTLNFIGVSNG